MVTQTKNGTAVALVGLVEKINASHKECLKGLRSSLEHAWKTGTLLLEAKERVQTACMG
jgi:hypothetical protein